MQVTARTTNYQGKTLAQVRKQVFSYYKKHLQGHSFLNDDRKILVHCTRLGGNKLSHGGNLYPKKACLVEVLPLLIKYGVYNNFGARKAKDGALVLGYFNFKAMVLLDGKTENIRFSIQVRKDGKFYYNHEVNYYGNKKA